MCYYENLRKRLQDEESKRIFDARIEYMQTSDTFTFIKTMNELYKNFQYLILDDFLKERKSQVPLVIFGAGCGGEITFEILKHKGAEIPVSAVLRSRTVYRSGR